MALRRTGTQIVSLGAVAALLAVGLAAIALGDRADAVQPAPTAPATADVRFIDTYDQLRYRAALGQHNAVAIALEKAGAPDVFTVSIDDDVEIRAGQGCGHPDGKDLTRVVCTISAPPKTPVTGPSLAVYLYDQDDEVAFSNLAGAKFAKGFVLGAGSDVFTTKDTGTYDGSSVWGNSGDDRIITRAGSTVRAGLGDDTVSGIRGKH